MSPTGQVAVFGGAFQDMEGNPLSLGYLVIELSHDENLASVPEQIVGGLKVRVGLNTNGNIPTNPPTYLFVNSLIAPANSYYVVRGFKQDGTQAFGPQYWIIPNTDPYNVGLIVPTNPPGSGLSTLGQITLQTNEVNNGSQNLLDLHAGSNITLTDNGSGRVTIAAASGGSSFTTAGQGLFFASDTVGPRGTGSGGSFNNRVVLDVNIIPLELESTYTVRKITIYLAANNGGPNLYVGIYNAAGTTLLLNSGPIATVFSGSIQVVQTTLGTPATLTPGYYQVGFGMDTSGNVQTVTNIDTTSLQGVWNQSFTRVGYATNQISGSALPATLGALNARTLAVPTIMFEV